MTMLRQVLSQAKKHPRLIPIFVFIGARGTGAVLYVTHLALSMRLMSVGTKRITPKLQNKLSSNEQYKFHSVNVDYSKLKKEGPDFYVKFFITLKLLRMKVFQKPSAQFST